MTPNEIQVVAIRAGELAVMPIEKLRIRLAELLDIRPESIEGTKKWIVTRILKEELTRSN